jgi:GNAT superfamily N-acetyltransferase
MEQWYMLTLQRVTAEEDLAAVRALFAEYVRAVDTPQCFVGFDRELAALPGGYAALFLAKREAEAAGCAGVRKLDATSAEMKRLYVRPVHRGQHVGRLLTEHAIRWAREERCERLLLDTLPQMNEALKLYLSLGFREIGAYLPEPTQNARCFELRL